MKVNLNGYEFKDVVAKNDKDDAMSLWGAEI